MQALAANCIWRKSTGAEWLKKNGPQLDAATGGSYAIIERPNAKRVRIEAYCETNAAAHGLVDRFGGVIDQLAQGWQARYFSAPKSRPLRIGHRLIVASDASQLPPDARVLRKLIIPAGAAFGTGEHATTAMSLRMLERVTRSLPPGWRMFDAGTGSGILALAAKCLGAGEVIAIDHDPLAVSVAKENARANGIGAITFITGDVERRLAGSFDLITANLFSELLISLLPKWRQRLALRGRLVLSGVMRNQEPDLAGALRRNGFEALEIRRRGKWIALLAAHQKAS